MLIDQQQIISLQQRIGYDFDDIKHLVYQYTFFFHHNYYIKKASLFRDHYLKPTEKPCILASYDYQQTLKKFRRILSNNVQTVLTTNGYQSPQSEQMLLYIIEESQFLLQLSKNFCLTREEDSELAKTQTLCVIQAVRNDCEKKNNNNTFHTWFCNIVQPFINEAIAVNNRSKNELLQEIQQQSIDKQKEQESLILHYEQSHAQNIQYLLQEIEMLRAYNTQLKNDIMSHAAPLFHKMQLPPPPYQRIVPEDPYSSSVSTERATRPNFINSVLQLPTKGLTTSASLEPLRGNIPHEEDSSEYFKQYPPYILEEIREGIDSQLKTIARKNLLPFVATLNLEKLPTPTEHPVNLSCTTTMNALPKLDHGFYKEAILIVTTPVLSRNHYRHRSFKQEEKKLEGILSIASLKRKIFDEDDESQNREVGIELILPLKDYKKHMVTWRTQKGQIRIHWLLGLIPSERMYEVSLSMPTAIFQEQFIRAQLLPWPNAAPNQENTLALTRLNPSQRAVVECLEQTDTGLYFLQGPPGTGKTTTAVSLLMQLTKRYPTERLLVCAPSNQAVRVLLAQTRPLLPDVTMALTGVAKNIPESLTDVFVHKYAHDLFYPLIYLKRQITKAQARGHGETPALERQVFQQYNVILDRLQMIETDMIVKQETKNGVLRLREKILQQKELCPENTNLIAHVEESINLIQSGAHYIESYLVQRAQLVFSTLVSSGRNWLHKQIATFSIVILDEAAQALVPEALIPLQFNPRLYIQIGDPNQLPATIVSKKAQEGGFANSMMHWLTKELKQPYEMLTTQYRMTPDICRWPSQQYYDGQLETDPSVVKRCSVLNQKRNLHPILKNKSCLFFNIKSGKENRRSPDLSGSIENDQEAEYVIKTARYLILTCGFQAAQIGIITFYSAQVALLERKMKQLIPKDKSRGLTVNTVDGFQGDERDITLISIVRTSESIGFLNDPRRLNVAMTRARDARWLFGSFSPLNKSNSDLPSLLAEHQKSQNVIEETDLQKAIEAYPSRSLYKKT